MVFSSLIFLFAYLPVTLICYYLVPRKQRNLILFLFSLVFYAWGEPIYLFLMVVSLTVAYCFGFWIEAYKHTNPKRAKYAMIASVAVSLSFLFFFKYYNFFAENLSRLPFVSIPTIEGLSLPIGISFYTFQIISYTVDVYRGDTSAQRNYCAFGTYVTLFPQLVAGPIVRYREIDQALHARHETVDLFASGVCRFCVGLAKKVLIGDAMAAGFAYCKGIAELNPTALGAWMIVIFYTLHLYYDFSGYSDMAIGLGAMFGFSFPENFRYPYISKSITEFWRRWHITLSMWFREYVYIPLGGNRQGNARRYFNLAVVWLLTGFWHGAAWNFVLWGVFYAVILICEKAFLLRLLEKTPALLRHGYTMLLVMLGFLIFSFSDLAAAWRCFCALFGVGVSDFAGSVDRYVFLRMLPSIVIAAVGATPLPRRLWDRLLQRPAWRIIAPPLGCLAVLLLSVAYLVDSTYSPFAYTQF